MLDFVLLVVFLSGSDFILTDDFIECHREMSPEWKALWYSFIISLIVGVIQGLSEGKFFLIVSEKKKRSIAAVNCELKEDARSANVGLGLMSWNQSCVVIVSCCYVVIFNTNRNADCNITCILYLTNKLVGPTGFISFIIRENNIGPSTVPWGTPLVISKYSMMMLSTKTRCLLLLMKLMNQFRIYGWISTSLSLLIKIIVWHRAKHFTKVKWEDSHKVCISIKPL